VFSVKPVSKVPYKPPDFALGAQGRASVVVKQPVILRRQNFEKSLYRANTMMLSTNTSPT
jgi:hypothetical protein